MLTDARVTTHVGFSDESNWNEGRFRSLGLVTAPLDVLDQLEEELRRLLEESKAHEFKWNKLRGAKEQFAADKMWQFAIDKASAGKLRVDVLVWDIQDSLHKVRGRDDVANLQRMYYHLFRNVLRLRWPDDAVWRLYLNEHTAMGRETVKDCLDARSAHIEIEPSLFIGSTFHIRLKREFSIEEINASKSGERLLLQLADLFAELAVFSKDKYDDYQSWLKATSPPQSLFEEDAEEVPNLSPGLEERFLVLKAFYEGCKQRKLGVSLREKCGLWTPKPGNPINFWLYEPRHPEDNAPSKNQQ